ncbi:MAG: carboxymuconolactone decarboxylase family protein [Rickettsiales bacterium]|nr:carboxymuconolactone decarboxylase family protein [Rickettsiales bacterium]
MANENNTLTTQQKNIALIASYTARGDMVGLEFALNKGLNEKLTVNEIKEVLIQMYAYCGFPRSLNAINTFIRVIDNRKNKGINDIDGDFAKTIDPNINKNEYGRMVRSELTGVKKLTAQFVTFTPAIDDFLKEHLFADIFGRGVLTYQDREVATIAALSSIKDVESQLESHIICGKNTGLTDKQINEILYITSSTKPQNILFGLGEKNDAYAEYFKGQSYLNPLTKDGVHMSNVTFEPKCRNNWHIHNKGGQILLVTEGRGYYQEWGKPARELLPGDVVNIPAGVKHWHGAAKDSWFTHIAIAVPAKDASTDWLEEVSDAEYNKLK